MSAHARRWGIPIERQTKGTPIAERTAAAIWSALDEIEENIFLWNVFPLHPHDILTNPSQIAHTMQLREMRVKQCLVSLIDLLRPRRLVAVGNKAGKSTIE